MELKKIVPRGNTGEGVRTIVLPWKGVKTLELWLESSTRVAKSPSRQKTSPSPCKVERDGMAGITRAGMPALGHVERPTHTTG